MKHNFNQPTVILIVGPTAVGKTKLAIELATHFNTEIVSADSRQCYRELNIGVAKPSSIELNTVTHHFINSHSIHEKVDAAVFEQYALDKVNAIHQQNPFAVMVGGTGLYIKAFKYGLDEIPAIPEAIRNHIIQQYQQQGINWLQKQVQQLDPSFWAIAEQSNPQRLMRALEVKMHTGNSIIDYRSNQKTERNFRIITIGLELPRPILYERINNRVDEMMALGLEDEVRSLIPFAHINALQTVGYTELFDYFKGVYQLDQAVDKIKQHTRNYAKRQLTWFKKDTETHWFQPHQSAEIINFIKNKK